MKKVDFDELDSNNERYADFEGQGFTGYAVEQEPGYISYRSFIRGIAQGPDYTITESGILVDYVILSINKPTVGVVIGWDEEGNLTSEKIPGLDGRMLLHREWDSHGKINLENKEHGFTPWVEIPKISTPDNVSAGSFTSTVKFEDLRQGTDHHEFHLNGEPFTGNVFHQSVNGEIEVRAVVDGREEGRVFRWSSTGKLIAQGVRRHPHGPVGPWHEWDERGRLLREIIYDALGNKIIHRELDDDQNIVQQEHFEPTTLMTDPETGEQRPAPWL